MGVPLLRGGNTGGGLGGGRGVCPEEAEYGRVVHVTQPILDLCEEALHWLGTRVSKRWWEQEVLDLVGVWEEAAAALKGGPELVDGKVGEGYWVTNTGELCST